MTTMAAPNGQPRRARRCLAVLAAFATAGTVAVAASAADADADSNAASAPTASLAAAPNGNPAQVLRARGEALKSQLANNAFHAPLYLESQDEKGHARGDVYAMVAHRFGDVDAALVKPQPWCDSLMLDLNVKHCEAEGSDIALWLGTKHVQSLSSAYRLDLHFAVQASSADYLRVRLNADKGPMSTKDYVFLFEAVPWGDNQTFVHFQYGVGYGGLSRMAMQGYFATVGRDKVGFSTVTQPGGGQGLVDGERGAIERNAMRYQFAISAYLDSLSLPESQRSDARLRTWFDATEKYAKQLHEVTRDEYTDMKHQELAAPRAGG